MTVRHTLVGLLAASSLMVLAHPNEAQQQAFQQQQQQQATVVVFETPELARAAAITFHDQLLAGHWREKKLILQLDPESERRVSPFAVQMYAATDWQMPVQATSQSQNGIAGFPCYETVEETYAIAERLVRDYPDYASWQKIGQGWAKSQQRQGHDLFVLKLTKNNGVANKPVLLINSAIHAREYATAPLALAFAQKLLTGVGKDADIDWILEQQEVHLILQSNPEGRKVAETGLLWRKNTNDNECSSGNFGVDLNRNFSFTWFSTANGSSGNSCNHTYRGTGAASEPETQAYENYIRAIFPDRRGPLNTDAAPADTAGLHLDIHSYSELILWPWGNTTTQAPNGQALQTLGRKLAFFNDYFPTQSIGLYPTDGTSDNPSYAERGVAAITFEIGTAFFQNCTSYTSKILPDNLNALMYAARVTSAPYLLPAGPDVTSLQSNAVAGKIQLGQPLNLNFTLTDLQSNQLNGAEPSHTIQAAELFLNAFPTAQLAPTQLLQAADGALDTPVEKITGTLNNLPLGKHRIYLRGKDAAGQYGPVYAYAVDVVEPPKNPLQKLAFRVECQFLACTFTNTSQFEPDPALTFLWQLTTTETSNQSSATYTFPAPGKYNVSLVANWQQQQSRSSQEVQVFAKPTATFQALCQGLRCDLQASAQSANGAIIEYQWSLDGKTANGNPLSYTFSTAGNYPILLRVTDSANQQSTAEQQVQVTAPVVTPPPPTNPPAVTTQKSGGAALFSWFCLMPYVWWRRRQGSTAAVCKCTNSLY